MSSDQELIARVCERDAAAFDVLLQRYDAMLRRHLRHTVRDADAAEDLLQETFLRVWTHSAQWDGRGPFKAWLFRIATNLALNYLRALRRRRQYPLELPGTADDEDQLDAPGWMIDSATLGPDALLEQAEWRQQLQRLIRDLPEAKRDVLRMVYDAEMEIREVAAALGIPEGTVKSRLHYATRRLARSWRDLTSTNEDEL